MNLFVANLRALLALWLWNLVDSLLCIGPPHGVASNEHRYPSPRIVILGATGGRRELCIFSPMTSPLIGWEEQPCQCACGEGQEFWWQELQPWLLQGSSRPHFYQYSTLIAGIFIRTIFPLHISQRSTQYISEGGRCQGTCYQTNLRWCWVSAE